MQEHLDWLVSALSEERYSRKRVVQKEILP